MPICTVKEAVMVLAIFEILFAIFCLSGIIYQQAIAEPPDEESREDMRILMDGSIDSLKLWLVMAWGTIHLFLGAVLIKVILKKTSRTTSLRWCNVHRWVTIFLLLVSLLQLIVQISGGTLVLVFYLAQIFAAFLAYGIVDIHAKILNESEVTEHAMVSFECE